MALNFQQVFEKIRQIGLGARARQETQAALRKHARSLLEAWADKAAELNATSWSVPARSDPSLRCAIPLDERLDASFPEPAGQKSATLLAADGSQILPDRHAAVQFSAGQRGCHCHPVRLRRQHPRFSPTVTCSSATNSSPRPAC